MLETFKDENVVAYEKNRRDVYEPRLLQDELAEEGSLAEKLERVIRFVFMERNLLFQEEILPFYYATANTSYRLAVSSLIERSTAVFKMFITEIEKEKNFVFPVKKNSPLGMRPYQKIDKDGLLITLIDLTSHGERLVQNIKENVDDSALFCGLHALWFDNIQELIKRI